MLRTAFLHFTVGTTGNDDESNGFGKKLPQGDDFYMRPCRMRDALTHLKVKTQVSRIKLYIVEGILYAQQRYFAAQVPRQSPSRT